MFLDEFIYRQLKFSTEAFGPGERRKGVIDHIRKELVELGAPPDDLEEAVLRGPLRESLRIARDRQMVRGQIEDVGDPSEWVDVVLLSMDALWRSLRARYKELTDHEIACLAAEMIDAKLEKNRNRTWPDWRTLSEDVAICHTKEPSDEG